MTKTSQIPEDNGQERIAPEQADALARELASHDGFERERARLALVEMGREAIPVLVATLSSKNEHVRWEATKALSAIGDPEAGPVLVRLLEDDHGDIRWLAAEGLVNLEVEGLCHLLEALAQHSESVLIRTGAHHTIRQLIHCCEEIADELMALLHALEGATARADVPVLARDALRRVNELKTQGECCESPPHPKPGGES